MIAKIKKCTISAFEGAQSPKAVIDLGVLFFFLINKISKEGQINKIKDDLKNHS